jgi:hypothetical protein
MDAKHSSSCEPKTAARSLTEISDSAPIKPDPVDFLDESNSLERWENEGGSLGNREN